MTEATEKVEKESYGKTFLHSNRLPPHTTWNFPGGKYKNLTTSERKLKEGKED